MSVEKVMNCQWIKNFKKTSKDFWEKTNRKSSTYRDDVAYHEVPFRSSLLVLGILGGIPIAWKKPHYPSLHPIKSNFILAVIIYSGVLYSVYRNLKFYIGRWMTENPPQHIKMIYIELYVLTLFSVVPVGLWTDVPTVKKGLLTFLKMSGLFYQITNKKVRLRWKKVEKCIIISLLTVPPITFDIVTRTTPEIEGKYIYAMNAFHTGVVCFLMGTLWSVYFSYVETVARGINADLTETMRQNTLTLEKLRLYQEIWIQMRAMTDDLSALNVPVIIAGVSVIALVIFFYSFLTLLRMGKYLISIPHLLLSLSVFCLQVVLCRASHVAVEQVKYFYSEILALEALGSEKPRQRQIITMYLAEKMRPAVPAFNSFVIVDKTLVSTICAVVASYLVILEQVMPSEQDF